MSETVAPHSSDNGHHHPNYVATWAVLVALLLVSLAVASLSKTLALILIFGIAIIKAVIVCGNFMHLRFEPKWLTGTVLFAVSVLLIFWFLVAPDVVPVVPVVVK